MVTAVDAQRGTTPAPAHRELHRRNVCCGTHGSVGPQRRARKHVPYRAYIRQPPPRPNQRQYACSNARNHIHRGARVAYALQSSRGSACAKLIVNVAAKTRRTRACSLYDATVVRHGAQRQVNGRHGSIAEQQRACARYQRILETSARKVAGATPGSPTARAARAAGVCRYATICQQRCPASTQYTTAFKPQSACKRPRVVQTLQTSATGTHLTVPARSAITAATHAAIVTSLHPRNKPRMTLQKYANHVMKSGVSTFDIVCYA